MNLSAPILLLASVLLLLPSTIYAQRVLMEDFVYPPGDSLTPYGWTSSSATNPIFTSAEGLRFGQYQGSGIGNAAILKSTGQDVQREFVPDTTGKFYVWALVNVTSARSGDYFVQLQPNAGSSVYVGRTYARLASNGGLTFGVAKRGTNTVPTMVYADSVYELGTTYLLVVRYEFKSGSSTNDEVTLYVFGGGELPQSEPPTAAVGPVTDATADPTILGALALRQGDQSRAPVLTIDGLRVTRGWDAFLPATLDPMEASLNAVPAGVQLSWKAWTEVGVEWYDLYRWSRTEGGYISVTPSMIPAGGASGQPIDYVFLDESAGAGVETYRLRLTTTGGGEYTVDSVSLDLPTGIETRPDRADNPYGYVGTNTYPILRQNYPNPFNPKSVISFVSPTTEQVSLDMYDILGRHLGVLFHGLAEGGRVYEIAVDGSELSTGVYVARLTWPGGATARRLAVLR